MNKNTKSNKSSSKLLNIIIYFFVVLLVLGVAASAIYSLTDAYSDGAETKYTITWGGGTLPDGYSFEYDCPTSATAGEKVTITITETVGGTSTQDAIYFNVKNTETSTVTKGSGALSFTDDNSYSFTMPEYNVTITYVVLDINTGAYV